MPMNFKRPSGILTTDTVDNVTPFLLKLRDKIRRAAKSHSQREKAVRA